MDWGRCPESGSPRLNFRKRLCVNPVPVFGGAYCEGDAVQSRKCGGFMISEAEIQ